MAKVLNLGAKARMGNEKCTRYAKREREQVSRYHSVFGFREGLERSPSRSMLGEWQGGIKLFGMVEKGWKWKNGGKFEIEGSDGKETGDSRESREVESAHLSWAC